MGLDTLKQTNISELPISGDISGEDYIIVQGKEVTTRVQFKDVYISKENTTFGQEINDLYEKMEGLTTAIQDVPTTTSTYTKSEIDSKLDTKQNLSGSLNSTEIETSYYKKNIIDGKFLSRPLKSEVYTKETVDSIISGISELVTGLQLELNALQSRIEYLETIHDPNGDTHLHFVPKISWNDLTDKPSTTAAATTSSGSSAGTTSSFSGDYNDLINKPSAATATSSGFMTPAQKSKLDSIDATTGKIPISIQNFGGGRHASGSSSSGYTLDSITFHGNGSDPGATYYMTHSTSKTKHAFVFKEYNSSFSKIS